MTNIAIILGCECFFAVMTRTAKLSGVDVIHFHDSGALFHLENLRMAIKAFNPGIKMVLAAEGHFAHGSIPRDRFTGLNCRCGIRQQNRNK